MTLFFLWTAIASVWLPGLDGLGCPGADRARSFAFGEQPGEKALAFADSLDLEGGRFGRLLQPLQSFDQFSRQ